MDPLSVLKAELSAHYRFESEIGRGGMAVVYLALDVKHGRRVAVKVLNPELGAIIGRERFLSEIRIAANLQHPNLLPLFDSGEVGGLLYYVMPYVEGESLRARIRRERQLPVHDALHIAAVVASALEHAHRHNVVHRDLKPENILLHEGEPLVADFGIALAVSNASGERLTQTGLSLGTPHYMSPEQAIGERAIDHRTDVYALGAVLYEMLTGEPPHTGATAQAIIAKVLADTPRSVSKTRNSVPAHVDAVIMRALAKVPADRWSSAQEFAAALHDPRIATSAIGPTSGAANSRRAGAKTRFYATIAVAAAGLTIGVISLVAALKRGRHNADDRYIFTIALPDSAAVSTGRGTIGGDVSISRDGRMIVYVAAGASGGDVSRGIWIRALNDLVARPVRNIERGHAPRFSPDGSALTYLADNELYTVRLDGGQPTRVTEHGTSFDWIDSGSIVFTKDFNLWRIGAQGSELWVTTVRNPSPRRAVPRDTARHIWALAHPSVLPGGDQALVTIWKGDRRNPHRELGVASLGDGSITELGVVGSNPKYALGHIVFVRDDGALYAAPYSADKRRIIGDIRQVAPQVVVKVTGWADFDIADNGTLMFVGGSEARRRLVLADRMGNVSAITPEIRRFIFPRVSRSGRTVAIEIGSPQGYDIWTYDFESRTLGALTSDHRSLRPAGWLDGDSSVAFLALDTATASWNMVALRADRREPPRVIIASAGLEEGAVGGSWIAVRRNDQGIDIAPIDGSGKRRVLMQSSARVIGLSHDGRFLAYESGESGTIEIYARSVLDGHARVQVSSGGGTEPVWSPLGDELFYRTATHLIAAKIATDPFRVLRRDTLFRDDFMRSAVSTSYDVMPDGQRFVMVQSENPELFPTIMMNWIRPH